MPSVILYCSTFFQLDEMSIVAITLNVYCHSFSKSISVYLFYVAFVSPVILYFHHLSSVCILKVNLIDEDIIIIERVADVLLNTCKETLLVPTPQSYTALQLHPSQPHPVP